VCSSDLDIQIARLGALLADRKIILELDESARAWLADKGYEPAFGARPLKRVIQKSISDPLSEQLLEGQIKDGDKIVISADGQGLVINGKAVVKAA